VDTSQTRVLLIETGRACWPRFHPRLSAKALRALQSLGVTTLLDHTVTDLDDEGVVVRNAGGEERIRRRRPSGPRA
jgi:NADH dehydrogenase FAD-containing subunit